MSRFVLIDGNNVGYACQHAGGRLMANGRPTQAIYHFMRTLRSLAVMYSGYRPIVLWDGKATWRYELWPSYKSDRNKDPKSAAAHEQYLLQKPVIYQVIRALGITQLKSETAEADDLAGYMAMRGAERGDEIAMITGDQDWLQLVGPGIKWHDIIRDRTVTDANFAEFTKYATPIQFLQAKAMQGDSSDKITAIGGFGETKAFEFLMEYGSVENFIAQGEAGKLPAKMPAAYKRLLTNEAPPSRVSKKTGEITYWPTLDAFRRNMRLMNLREVEPKMLGKPLKERQSFDADAVLEVCRENSFQTLIHGFDSWSAPFRKGEHA